MQDLSSWQVLKKIQDVWEKDITRDYRVKACPNARKHLHAIAQAQGGHLEVLRR